MRWKSNINRIGLQRLIQKGIRVSILPSYACNYSCSYCGRQMDANPKAKLKTLEEWKRYLIDLDKTFKLDRSRIKEIILTGGEPTILPYFTELCEFILDRWLLTVYTNLSNIHKLRHIRQSTRLIVHATFHPDEANSRLFNHRWKTLDKIHRVVVDEIGERKLSYPYKKTRLKPMVKTADEFKDKLATLRVDPNHAAYLYCTADTQANTN